MPNLKVPSENAGERLDVWLAARFPDYSRAFLQKWVKAGRVRVQGKAPTPSDHLHAGDVIEVTDFASAAVMTEAPKPPRRESVREDGSASPEPKIIFEDDSLLVLNKPAGLVVHPAPSYRGSTLIDWLRRHMGGKVAKQFTDPERLGLVHRLDKDTSGVLVIAKSVTAQIAVSRQFRERTVRKTYAAWVQGIPSSASGLINAPVGRSRKDPTRMAVTGSGRASETSFDVEESLKEVSLLTLHPKTGRTHQIRVHTSALGHPIVGDTTYGSDPAWKERCGIQRPMLHAAKLELTHPQTGKKMIFEAKLPPDFVAARKAFLKAARHLALLVMVAGFARAAMQTSDAASAPTENSTPAPAAKTHHKSSGASGTSTAALGRQLRKEIGSVKDQVDALQADVSAMKDQIAAIEAGLTQLDVARRLRDLERALPDVNAKLSVATNNAEEARSQAMDASRKVRSLQEASDQFRDQLDKLQRQLIQQRAKTEESSIEADEKASDVPATLGKAVNP